MSRMTGIWELASGPPLPREDPTEPNSMLGLLRRITEAIPPDAPVHAMTIRIGNYEWIFRRLAPLTLLEGPDGAYAVLAPLTPGEPVVIDGHLDVPGDEGGNWAERVR